MLAKLTTKNQLTLPKAATQAVGAAEYFDVQTREGQIILTPVRIQRADAGGVTGVVLLAESHLAVHTWPELSAVTLDVYVCNFGGDNTAKAERLLAGLEQAFGAQATTRHRVLRGEAAVATEAAPAPAKESV